MYKRLLVFSLAFCLGVGFLQLFKPDYIEPDNDVSPQNRLTDQTVPNVSQSIQSNWQKSAFVDCLYNFQNALAEDDKNTVVSLMKFPVEVTLYNEKDKPYIKKFKNKEEFLQNYDKIFDASFKRFIARLKSSHLFASTSGEVFILRSQLRFKSFYENDGRNFEIKVTSINKYSNFK